MRGAAVHFSTLILSVEAVHVVTSPWPPIVSCEIGSTDFDTFSGYDMDLLRQLASLLQWTDVEVSCLDWDSMMLSVESGKSDFAFAGITVLSSRLPSLKFSIPTYESGLTLVTRVQRQSLTTLLFSPFESLLWVCLLGAGVLLSHCLWIVERGEGGALKLSYREGILEALWVVFASFFFTRDCYAKRLSGRVMILGLEFAAFLIFAVYIGSLTARLTMPFPDQRVTSYDGLADMTIGTFTEYVAIIQLFSSNVKAYPWSDSAVEIISALKAGEVDAIVLEHPQALYYSVRECGLTVINFNFVEQYYAIAFSSSQNDTFIASVSTSLSRLQEAFVYDALMNKYLNQANNEPCTSLLAVDEFTAQEVWGVFLLLAGGFVLSLPLFTLQLFCKRKNVEVSEEAVGRMEEKKKKAAQGVNLVQKFDRILVSADFKLGNKLKALERRLQDHVKAGEKYEEAVKALGAKLEKMFA